MYACVMFILVSVQELEQIETFSIKEKSKLDLMQRWILCEEQHISCVSLSRPRDFNITDHSCAALLTGLH